MSSIFVQNDCISAPLLARAAAAPTEASSFPPLMPTRPPDDVRCALTEVRTDSCCCTLCRDAQQMDSYDMPKMTMLASLSGLPSNRSGRTPMLPTQANTRLPVCPGVGCHTRLSLSLLRSRCRRCGCPAQPPRLPLQDASHSLITHVRFSRAPGSASNSPRVECAVLQVTAASDMLVVPK